MDSHSGMETRRVKLSAPLTNNACVALVDHVLQKARSDDSTNGAGLTVDLSHQRIANIPPEAINMMKDDVKRLAISHNQLASFESDFALCSRLRYLNVKSNLLREFPQVLCSMRSLEILDISRNKIRELPHDFGYLLRLKVFAISKNKIQVLPNYIAQMDELKVLKIDYNPIVYPPREITEYDDSESWLDELKAFLRQNLEKEISVQDAEDSAGTSDGENDTDVSNISKVAIRINKADNGLGIPDDASISSLNADDSFDSMMVPAIPTKNLHRRPNGSISKSYATVGTAATPTNTAQNSERMRSNSESVPVDRATKRMGYIGQKNALGTVEEARPSPGGKHQRGNSYDSSINEASQRASSLSARSENPANPSGSSRTKNVYQPEPYFRRISSIPKATSSSSSTVDSSIGMAIVEISRSVLYAIYQVQPAIDLYVNITKERNRMPTTGFDLVLPAANLNIDSLVQALEACENKDGSNTTEVLINSTHSTIIGFRHVLTQLQAILHQTSSGSEARYTRSLLLAIFGSLIELHNAWLSLQKYIAIPNPSRAVAGNVGGKWKLPMPSPLINSTSVNQHMTRPSDSAFIPSTPGISFSDNPLENPDELLFEKLFMTIVATTQTISLLNEAIKKTVTQQQPQVPGSTMQKLKDLDKMCSVGGEFARRLKLRLETIRDADGVEKRRFYEDIRGFATCVMSIGESLKAGSQEFGFPKHILGGLAPIARWTKDVTVLLHASSFRAIGDPVYTVPSNSVTSPTTSFSTNAPGQFQPLSPTPMIVPSTPLSAALGPAAQATMPFLVPNMQSIAQVTSSSGQRSDTMQSNIRSMTGISEMNIPPIGMLSPRR